MSAYYKSDRNLFSKRYWTIKKHQAKDRDLDFCIEREDFPIPDFCPVLGIPLNHKDREHTASLDRVDNIKGYTKENTIVISFRANRLKSDASVIELTKLANFYGKL